MRDQTGPLAPFRAYTIGGGPGGVTPLGDIAALRWAMDETSLDALVVYLPPPAFLAAAKGKGKALTAVRATWREAANAFLAIHRQNRDRIVVVERPTNEASLREVAAKLKERWSAADVMQCLTASAGAEVQAGPMSIAAICLRLDPKSADLADALQAATTGPCLASGNMKQEINQLANAWEDHCLEADGRVLAAKKEQSVLRETLNEKIALVESAKKEASEAKEIGKILERQVVALERELKAMDHKMSLMKKELGAVYGSTSWRITKPVRIVKTRLGGKGG